MTWTKIIPCTGPVEYPGPRRLHANFDYLDDLPYSSVVGAQPWSDATDDSTYVEYVGGTGSSTTQRWACAPIVPSEPIDLTGATTFTLRIRTGTSGGDVVSARNVLYSAVPNTDLNISSGVTSGAFWSGDSVNGTFAAPALGGTQAALDVYAPYLQPIIDQVNAGNGWAGVSVGASPVTTARIYGVWIELEYPGDPPVTATHAPPLRQTRRNDGLRGSVRSLRATSRQRSLRRGPGTIL